MTSGWRGLHEDKVKDVKDLMTISMYRNEKQ